MLPAMTSAQSVRIESGANKSPAVAWVLWIFLGILGGHRFYLRRPGTGFLWMVTLGLFLVGWIVDAFRLNTMVRKVNFRGY